MTPRALLELPDLTLRTLASSLRSGPLQRGINETVVQSLVGSSARAIVASLRELLAAGFTTNQTALLIETVLAERGRHPRPESIVELVLSGPEVDTIPTQDTAAVMQTLVTGAEQEILLVGYAVHDGRTIFRDVAERMDAVPALEVTLCLDIHRGGDSTAAAMLVERFAEAFRQRHWPGKRVPSLFYFPASLALDPSQRASLHAKCVVVDRSRALVTSANFTEAAQERNIEVGLLVRHASLGLRLATYFEALCRTGVLCPIGLHG